MATAAPPRFQPQPLPPVELYEREEIHFHHPGYPPPTNTLLSLPRVDRTADAATFGVCHKIALLACQIIAGNAFDTGRLALDRAGQQPVNVPLDGILTEREYYFVIDGLDPYAIVPSFRDWEFPHDRIPDSWPPTSICAANISQGLRCGITNASFAIDEAHLVPKEEALWYQRNGMLRYGSEEHIDNAANILRLKSDIHRCFDYRWFAIVPKISQAETGVTTPPSPQYVMHILRRNAAELWPTYHDTLVQYLDRLSHPFLFARFAWAILLRVKPFINMGLSRRVIRVCAGDEGEIEHKVELLSGPQLRACYGGGGSKAATPISKRRSGAGSVADGEDDHLESCGEDSDIDIQDEYDLWDVVDNGEKRGRKRRLQTSSETAPDTKLFLAADVEADLKASLLKGIQEQQTASQDSQEVEMSMRLR